MYTYAEVNLLRAPFLEIMEDVKRSHPKAWAVAHRQSGAPGNLFARLVAREGQRRGHTVGVNGKRGNPDDLSQDCIDFPVSSGGAPDATGRYPGVVIIDFIAGAGSNSASLTWIDQTGPTISAGTKGAYVDPVFTFEEVAEAPATPPPTTPPPPHVNPYPPTVTPPAPERPCLFVTAPPLDRGALDAHLDAINIKLGELFDQMTKRMFGVLPKADGSEPDAGIAHEAAARTISWLQNNRIRVRF